MFSEVDIIAKRDKKNKVYDIIGSKSIEKKKIFVQK